jgi:hypothetical protein
MYTRVPEAPQFTTGRVRTMERIPASPCKLKVQRGALAAIRACCKAAAAAAVAQRISSQLLLLLLLLHGCVRPHCYYVPCLA